MISHDLGEFIDLLFQSKIVMVVSIKWRVIDFNLRFGLFNDDWNSSWLLLAKNLRGGDLRSTLRLRSTSANIMLWSRWTATKWRWLRCGRTTSTNCMLLRCCWFASTNFSWMLWCRGSLLSCRNYIPCVGAMESTLSTSDIIHGLPLWVLQMLGRLMILLGCCWSLTKLAL